MGNTVSGYAVRFGDETTIAGEFREKVKYGAFTRTLQQNPDVLALLAHDYGRVLGRTTSGTLTLKEDRIGLWFSLEADPTTPSGAECIGTVRRGDIHGCSFGFNVRKERWEDGGDRLPLRIIEDVDLWEITLTASPAYKTTDAAIAARSTPDRVRLKAEAAMKARGIAL
ncbi:HK97 family phage prohead protease [Rhizobium petrolearium]|uniref:HK97 family phage prohead protease n=1 Tax=Neorhizobium petrolearium TaxID=515361 RepID=UPI001AE1C53E|nr:HK97 family phage prohead protease [Neorhizobium petrolearium]MBP1848497.1 HK97 family phage prohead protease [Neorhizobium petrolearium]